MDTVSNLVSFLELETAQQQEAKRRRQVLGELVCSPYDYHAFTQRSRKTRVPISVLKNWHDDFCRDGEKGLRPSEWHELDVRHHEIVLERLQQLGDYMYADVITKNDFTKLAQQNSWQLPNGLWNEQRARRLIDRYQVGGIWGLAPTNDPIRTQRARNKQKQAPPRDYSTLDEPALATIEKRLNALGTLRESKSVSSSDVLARAKETGVSERTLWDWLSRYREHGRIGLAPRQRSDKDSLHGVSERIEKLIIAVRLSYRDATHRKVFKEVGRRAQFLGEKAPSMAQVRRVVANISEPVKLIADGRKREFNNSYRSSCHIRFDKIVYQIDHTKADLLLRDIRRRFARTDSEETRGFLTVCIESNSRRVLAFRFGYDQPNSHNVVSVIRDAILVGGIPDEIWVDFGEDLISDHVRQFLKELDIEIVPTIIPQHKGRVERIFKTFNSQHWAEQDGYTHSNVVERNDTVVARQVISEAERSFAKYVDEEYHQAIHSSIDMSPMEYWSKNCFAEPCDPRLLDEFLGKPEYRSVGKIGIQYNARLYWHSDLNSLVKEQVMIRSDPSYYAPDTIEVYYNGYWLCQAIAIDSEAGLKITGYDVSAAQRRMRQNLREQIDPQRKLLRDIDKEIAREEQSRQIAQLADGEEGSSSSTDSPNSATPKRTESKREQAQPDADSSRPATPKKRESRQDVLDLM